MLFSNIVQNWTQVIIVDQLFNVLSYYTADVLQRDSIVIAQQKHNCYFRLFLATARSWCDFFVWDFSEISQYVATQSMYFQKYFKKLQFRSLLPLPDIRLAAINGSNCEASHLKVCVLSNLTEKKLNLGTDTLR